MATDFSIIIVNWNTSDLLNACLQSIIKHSTTVTFEVIVIDNASTDGSCELVQSQFPEVVLVSNRDNLGFSRANNQGIRLSQSQYIVLLNPDTIFLNDVLGELEQVFDLQPDVGIIGARLIRPDNTLQRWARGRMLSLRTAFNHYLFLSDLFPRNHFFAGLVDNVDYQVLTNLDWVSGACLAIRREVLDEVGLLDESIFMYSEDMELCYRVKQAGYLVVYAPTVQVKHFMSQGMQQQKDETILAGPLYSQDAFYQHLYGQRGLFLFRLIVCLGSLLRLLRASIIFILHPNDQSRYRLHQAKYNLVIALRIWKGLP